jgi:formamidopyrimidine-DNA glycosylase
MSGPAARRARRTSPDETHLRVRLAFADGRPRAALRRPAHLRRAGRRRRRRAAAVDARPHRPRPARPGVRRRGFVEALRRRAPGVKRALLDQTLVSGIGNIYADEALWRVPLHGARPTETLPRTTARRCWGTCATC